MLLAAAAHQRRFRRRDPCLPDACSTAVGVRCKDGVILGVEKLLAAKMLIEGSGRRIATIDEHVGAVSDIGLVAD